MSNTPTMSTMDIVAMYQMATANLYKIGGTIFIILGTIGGVLSVCVFAQKSMRKNPGSTYFIAFNISNLLLLWITLFPFVYRYFSGFDLTIHNLVYCRLRTYLLNVLLILPLSYLILSSIDRALATSRNALTRQRSTHRLAFWSVGGMTILWLFYYIPIWFTVEIQPIAPGVSFCFFDPGAYAIFSTYSTMTVTGFLPPVIMTIFGLKTWRNVQQVRIQPIANERNINRPSSKNRQLAIMLLFEILISVICSLAGSIIGVYTQRVPNTSKTLEQQALDYFLLDFGLNLTFIQACVSFYSNFIVSKAFRKNIRTLLKKVLPPFLRRPSMNLELTIPSRTVHVIGDGETLRQRPTVTNK